MFGRSVALRLVILLVGIACRLPSDEGMWPFNQLPLAELNKTYDFVPPPGWSEHLMRSSVRVSSGGSGSLVSPRGLVMTNHHVGSDAIQKLSTPERNLMRDGFQARSLEDELRCPDLEILSLVEIIDVTERVRDAVLPGSDSAAAGKARREAIAVIEQESKDSTGLTSEVVTLYGGGLYHLYRYKRYADVRLVLAPETAIAFFGGDTDNFEYPRHCLDVCFFRVYEDGKPAEIEHYLRWSAGGAREGELVFVSGHPGSTKRLYTLDHLRFLRDVEYPYILDLLALREIGLQQFSLLGPEEERMAREDLFGIQNARKARRGGLAGLLDARILQEKAAAEVGLQAQVAADASLGASLGDWERVAASRRAFPDFYEEYQLLERGRAFWSRLFGIGRTLVRLAEEREKPNSERLPGYRESDTETLELGLYSPAPIYPALESATLAESFTLLATRLGAEHPLTRLVLRGQAPAERAAAVISGTKLAEVEARRQIAAGGRAAILGSTDPVIELARLVDPYARSARRKYEDLVESEEREAYGRLSEALFRVRGTSLYPDATFTLRLAFGLVKGYREGGVDVAPFTRIGGAFAKHEAHSGRDPFALPPAWLAARAALDLDVPFNFVSTADIVGGNSGSPVTNRRGEVVGIIFDGNIQSLVLDYTFTEVQARAVAVTSQSIVEALRKVYRASALAEEIEGDRRF